VRVCTDHDYKPFAECLKKGQKSQSCCKVPLNESGDSLFKEFPKQTTFGDLDPVIERTDSISLHTDFSSNESNVSYKYEKDSAFPKEEIASKLDGLLMKSPSFSIPRG
jgi:hypothetical protein